jgi:tetratricopeptide (TPR) repeat protein
VKPANILVADDDRTYLSDFGVVKELASNGTTRTGSFVGTIEYSAPEQIEGRQVDARADVYALACVLYECLAGTPPFHRPSEVAVLNAHLHAPPPKLTRAVPEIAAAVEPVIAKALSKSPLDRYASCGEFVAALRTAAGEPRIHRRRLAISLALLVLAALVGAGIALGVHSLATGDTSRSAPLPTAPAKQESVSLDRLLLRSEDARTLNDAGFALVQAREYARALPLLQKAVKNAHVGTLTRGYATFNLGYALLKLGRCREALKPLQRALRIEAKTARKFIRPQIRQAQLCVQRAASATGR